MTAAHHQTQKKRSPAATGLFAEKTRDNGLDSGSANIERQSDFIAMHDAQDLHEVLVERFGRAHAPRITQLLFQPTALLRFTTPHGLETGWACCFVQLGGAAFGDSFTGAVECFVFQPSDACDKPEPSQQLLAMVSLVAKVVKARDLAAGLLLTEDLCRVLLGAGPVPNSPHKPLTPNDSANSRLIAIR